MQLSPINWWALIQYVGSNQGNETKDAAIQTECIHVNKAKQGGKQMEALTCTSLSNNTHLFCTIHSHYLYMAYSFDVLQWLHHTGWSWWW